jgi:hypothetical protein
MPDQGERLDNDCVIDRCVQQSWLAPISAKGSALTDFAQIADCPNAAFAGPTPGRLVVIVCAPQSSHTVFRVRRLERIVKKKSMQNVTRVYESARCVTTICFLLNYLRALRLVRLVLIDRVSGMLVHGGRHGACKTDKMYTQCLTPRICVVPMARERHAALQLG